MDHDDLPIEEIKAEADDFYSDDSLYNISSWGADYSFRELITRYDEEDLIKPEMQRNYVWEKSEASRFIDSILLGLPVPSIFLAKTPDERMLIVDGYQRIMTVYDYVRGVFSRDNKSFSLTKSEKINRRWCGKTFAELSDSEKRKINNTTIHCIIFVQVHPEDDDTSMYQVFERINTSGRTLLPQEIRNCVYQGAFNELLIQLNRTDDWRFLLGSETPDIRMRDTEFILRFLALKSDTFKRIDSRQISLKKFLNEFMGSELSKDETILSSREDDFLATIKTIRQKLGPSAFHNLSPKDPSRLVRKFNPTIFDSISIAVFEYDQTTLNNLSPSQLKERRMMLLRNEEYQDLIRVRTTDVARIRNRIGLAKQYLFDDVK